MAGQIQEASSKAALTVNEFCATCSIGRTSFYEALKAGRLKVLKFGKRTLVPASQVEVFLASLSSR